MNVVAVAAAAAAAAFPFVVAVFIVDVVGVLLVPNWRAIL
jgi:hypothetical protein